MTLLQRAPREVYRVFDEEEFLARATHEPRPEAAAPAPAERRLRRIAGTTVLLAATGAVGGLLATASVFSASGTRRRAGVRRPASPSMASSGALPWPTSPVDGARALRQRTMSRGSRDVHAHQRATHVRDSRRPRVALQAIVSRRPVALLSASRRVSVAVVGAQRSVPSEVAPSRSRPPVTLGVSQSQRTGRSEFGFER